MLLNMGEQRGGKGTGPDWMASLYSSLVFTSVTDPCPGGVPGAAQTAAHSYRRMHGWMDDASALPCHT